MLSNIPRMSRIAASIGCSRHARQQHTLQAVHSFLRRMERRALLLRRLYDISQACTYEKTVSTDWWSVRVMTDDE